METEKNKVIIQPTNEDLSIIQTALQLSEKDKRQLWIGFQSESYEMATAFLWKKTLDSLKKQLSMLSMPFISELLGKVGPDELIDYREIPDYDTLRLAEELGFVSGTTAFRLKKSLELVNYFASVGDNEDEIDGMNKAEAVGILLSCVNGVLSKEKLEAALNFKEFRDALEEKTISNDDEYIQKLTTMPYFYLRTTTSIIVSIIKKDTGAQLENALANANLIIPLIWEKAHFAERFLIGRCYADLYAEGKNSALSGIKKILLKVKGFDYVPEDLRSRAFIMAAENIIRVHFSLDNFYFEPAAINTLSKMGSVIPTPAIPVCFSAVLCVYLGNYYGVSYNAQPYASEILSRITTERWSFYFDQCLGSDDRILLKLTMGSPVQRWLHLFEDTELKEIISSIKKNVSVKSLLEATLKKNESQIINLARKLYSDMGYSI